LSLRGEIPLLILQYLYDRSGKSVPIGDLETVIGKDIYTLRPAIEDLKTEGFISEDEYRIEIKPAGIHFAQSRWA
jgi:hypothetical protein